MTESGKERRKSERHPVSEGSVFVSNHVSKNLLIVKNISAEGLQLVYFPDTSEAPDCQSIDIMQHPGTYFCVAGVCCRMVYDIPSLSEKLSFSGVRTCLAGLEFTDLNEEQKQMLSCLMDAI